MSVELSDSKDSNKNEDYRPYELRLINRHRLNNSFNNVNK